MFKSTDIISNNRAVNVDPKKKLGFPSGIGQA